MESVLEDLIPLVAIIFVFGIPGIIIFWAIHARHREKMRLIEKGLTPDEIKQYFSGLYKGEKNPYAALKWGMLLAFLGLGFFLSEILVETTDASDSITPAFLLFFAGLAFLIYYFIVSKRRNGAEKQ